MYVIKNALGGYLDIHEADSYTENINKAKVYNDLDDARFALKKGEDMVTDREYLPEKIVEVKLVEIGEV